MQTRQVAVTGVGIISPVGNDCETAWQSVIASKSGITRITLFDPQELDVQIAGEVKDMEGAVAGVLDAKENRRASRYIKLAAKAAREAVLMAGDGLISNPKRSGCVIGVGLGALGDIEKSTLGLEAGGQKKVSPFFIPYAIPNMATGLIAKYHDLQGVNLSTTAACASGSNAIGEGFHAIKYGHSDVMVCGGAEAAISKLGIAAFANMKALSTRNAEPERASRPFDRDRDGFVTGEGAGVLVLEELTHAENRGAKIYATIIGYGNSGDAYHITAPRPHGEGMKDCMALAVQEGEIQPHRVSYINAHGTSTALNDTYESEAIGDVFGEHANNLFISSTKSVTGHCLGGAGGIEAVFTVLAIRDELIPPTANYENRAEGCPWNYVPNEAISCKIDCALSNSFGFGGVNAALLFQSYR